MVTALFALHSDRGDIKRTERGNYKLILKDLDQEHIWFTDRPGRMQGSLTSEEITEGWDSYFSDDSPNSVVSFQDKNGDFQRLVFEQYKPHLNEEGTRLTSRIKPFKDPVTGFRLERGETLAMRDPSVVVDDYTMSSIEIINNTQNKMQVDYVIGEFKPGAIPISRDLPAGEKVTVAGTTHDKWDISAQIKVWDKVSYKVGLIVQADNPWYGKPQLEMNMTGHYHSSNDLKQYTWYMPNREEQWLLATPKADYSYQNDDPNDGTLNKSWTIKIDDA